MARTRSIRGGTKPPISAASSQANSIVVGSSPSGPTIYRPTGNPSPVKPIGAHGGVSNATQFDTTQLGLKGLLLRDDFHETLLSAGLGWGLPGGNRQLGAHAAIEPGIFFGRGFGDLPDSLSAVRPVAISGAVSIEHPTVTGAEFGRAALGRIPAVSARFTCPVASHPAGCPPSTRSFSGSDWLRFLAIHRGTARPASLYCPESPTLETPTKLPRS